jgi:prophage antirepressor-like protein
MKELMFNDQPIRLIEKNGKQWASAADIARALGYARADKVARIYDRHRAEFSKSMTMIVETPTLGASSNLVTNVRVFSLRGSHLIAMFARTDRAQEFRRWVLDVLDKHRDVGEGLATEYHKTLLEYSNGKASASLYGRGLSQWKRLKNPLEARMLALANNIQPSLI